MKTCLLILGGIFAVLLVIGGIAAVIFVPRFMQLDREGTAYIEAAVPKIVNHWDSQQLVDRATPQLLASAKSRAEIDNLFTIFKRLGSFKQIDKTTGGVISNYYTGTGRATIGRYLVQAEFEGGAAMIRIEILRVGESWKINTFHIDAKAFQLDALPAHGISA